MSRRAWKVLPPALKDESCISGVPPLLYQLLYNRGVRGSSQIEAFLAADGRLVGDPFLLPDMDVAVSRVYRALLSGERIAVYGDFDADGITATALLVEGLSSLGGRVMPYIPHRLSEGYGVRVPALQRLQQEGVSLVITCDSGIGAINEAREARRMGLDLIITDHHVPLDCLPEALAVVNPKRADCQYPFCDLAGVGVAYKLIEAIMRGRGESPSALVDLVALGTVADMSPLVGENRYLVREGVKALNSTSRPGLRELMRCVGVEPGSVRSETISWALAPRLNATGRLDRATASYDLLLTRVPEEAGALAQELERNNAERQRLTREVFSRVRDEVVSAGLDGDLLMSGGEDYPAGVVGIVAGRLVEEFYRPVFIFKMGSDVCRGSGRSIPEFNIMGALQQCADLLLEFGGHSGAAGFTVATSNLPLLKDRLRGLAAKQLANLKLRPHIVIDAEAPLRTMNWELYRTLQQLAPFGSGNPVPVFLSRNVGVHDWRRMGSQNDHLRLKLRDGNMTWSAVAFGLGGEAKQITPYVDVVYNLELDQWGGNDTLRLNLLDFAPSQP